MERLTDREVNNIDNAILEQVDHLRGNARILGLRNLRDELKHQAFLFGQRLHKGDREIAEFYRFLAERLHNEFRESLDMTVRMGWA